MSNLAFVDLLFGLLFPAWWKLPFVTKFRTHWIVGPWYGGAQNVWGEENVPENMLSRKFLDPSKRASGLRCRGFLHRKNRALTAEGGGKRTVRGGSKTPFWEGCHSWGFPPPSFFHPPPWRPLRIGANPDKSDLVNFRGPKRLQNKSLRNNYFCNHFCGEHFLAKWSLSVL